MTSIATYDKVLNVYEKTRDEISKRKSVFGVGHGYKEKEGKMTDIPSIIIYVDKKLDPNEISKEELIPEEIDGIPTDVVPLSHHRHGVHDEHDNGFLNHSKIHDENLKTMQNQDPNISNDVDIDNIAVIEDDPSSSFILSSPKFEGAGLIDWVHAYNKFRKTHPDVYDFVTFWTTSDIGDVKCECGAFYCGLDNDAQGIGWRRCWPGGRTGWNTSKLQAFHYFIRTDEATLLQEMGHHWGAFVGFKENQTDTQIHYDHLLGNQPGHWSSYMDDDHSPMDYDDYPPAHGNQVWEPAAGVDWVDNKNNTFTRHKVSSGEFVFCDLDLYLMGLIPPSKVKPFFYIKNPSGSGKTISGQAKYIDVQNIVLANGERRPDSSSSQKVFKQAIIILTKDVSKVPIFARDREQLRKKYNRIFYHATKYLAKVDTTLSDSTVLPLISNVKTTKSENNVTITWNTNVPTTSVINYSAEKENLLGKRFVEHSVPYQTISDSTFKTQHEIILSDLEPEKRYYFEVNAETDEGLLDRNSNNDDLFEIELDKRNQLQTVRDFLVNRIRIVNKATGDTLQNYKVINSIPDLFAEREHGILNQLLTTVAFEDRHGRPESDNDFIDVILEISHTENKVNSARGVQLGGDNIEVFVDGNSTGLLTRTKEIPL